MRFCEEDCSCIKIIMGENWFKIFFCLLNFRYCFCFVIWDLVINEKLENIVILNFIFVLNLYLLVIRDVVFLIYCEWE